MTPGKPSQALTRADKAELATRVVLTPAIRDAIVNHIRDGGFERQACDFAGIDFVVFQQWKRWAQKGLEPYTSLFRDIQKTEQECLRESLAAVRAGHKEWKAAAWWISHRFPYWREGNLTDEVPPAPGMETLVSEVRKRYSPEEIAKIVAELSNADPDPVMPPLLPEATHDGSQGLGDSADGGEEPARQAGGPGSLGEEQCASS